MDVLKAKLEIARSAAGLGAKRKRADADVVPYSRELKKGRQELEEKREVFLGGIVIEEVEVGDDDDAGGESTSSLFIVETKSLTEHEQCMT